MTEIVVKIGTWFLDAYESNGCLEGTNRKIKQIERTAYGYANFNHLVTRIKLEEKDAIIKEKASDYYLAA